MLVISDRDPKVGRIIAQPLDYSLAGASAAGASAAGASAAGASAAGASAAGASAAGASAAGVSTAGVSTPVVTLLSLPVVFESAAGAVVSVDVLTFGWAGGSQPTAKATTSAARLRIDLFIGGTP